jgi:TRAP transporter 4TM/12TM fusion protein
MSIDASGLNLEAERASRFRQLQGFPRLLRRTAGILMPLCGLIYIVNVPLYLARVSLFPHQFLGVMLGLVLTYVYLVLPASPKMAGNPKVPWYDWLLILASLSGGLYITFFYPVLLLKMGVVSTETLVFGGALVLAVLEATRRLTGWPLLIIVAVFALYARYGHILPGFLEAKPTTWPRLLNQLYLGADFVFGTALQTAGAVVLAFVLFGQFLFGTGGAKFLLDLAQATMGRYRGGPAKIAIVASGLFGTLSGSAVGNVAAVGVVTIPLMKRIGYSSYFAGGVEAVSSTGGVIMPPVMGAAAFIMAQLLGVPYYQVAIVAAVPAVLYYLGEFIQVDLRAAREGLKGIPKADLPSLKQTLIEGWVYIFPALVLIYCLFTLRLPAELAAIYSILALVIVASIKPSTRKFWLNLPSLLEGVTSGMLEVVVICAAAGLVIGILSYTGLGISFSQILVEASGGNLLLLGILAAVASTILGMGMPITACYLFLATLAAPAMVKLGVPPILAHLFVFYFGAYSFLTPPVCMAVYAAAAIAKAPLLKTAWQAMKLAVAGYIVPFIFIYKPAMVFMGTPVEVVWAIIDALLAVFCMAAAAEGFLSRQLSIVERILYLAAALAFFVPGWTSRIAGFVLLALLLIFHYRKRPFINQKTNLGDCS